jgi:hypothetical protein
MNRRLALAALLVPAALSMKPARSQPTGAESFSAAERAVFNEPVLSAVEPPLELHYLFSRKASDSALPPAFEDHVRLRLRRGNDGKCCAVNSEFLSGAQELRLPELDDARVNPVTLFFLEREVRELQRQTGGQAAHFRKRIRLALVDAARVQTVRARYGTTEVEATEVSISPFADDPQRLRYASLAAMQYRFIVSPAVPGGVLELRALLPGSDAAATPRAVEVLALVPAPVAR